MDETKDSVEKKLLQEYATLRDNVLAIKESLEQATEKFEEVEKQLVELLEADGKKKTAEYLGIGFLAIEKPRVFANVKEENKEILFAYLRESGRGDIVKETVNAGSLSSLVKERLEAGLEVPDCISYYLKPVVKFYKRS